MARYIIAATPLPGHVAPLLGIARVLAQRGDDVVVLTGSLFRGQAEAAGASFVALPQAADIDYRRLDERFPERATLPAGPAQMLHGLRHIFIDAMPVQLAGLRALLAAAPTDAIIADQLFLGIMPLLLGPRSARPPIVTCGISALAVTSTDTAFFGTGLPPGISAAARQRNAAMNRAMTETVLAPIQAHFNAVLHGTGAAALHAFVGDAIVTLPDHYLQLTSPAFEYPRSDLPPNVRFVGPLLPPPTTQFTPPPWWSDLAEGRKCVLVTQGTLANADLTELIAPTLNALAGHDLLVIAATGGPDPSLLGQLPANARAAAFLPFDRLLPSASLLITNGGYGAVNHALSLGVPLIVAGDTEEKPEIAARVAWSGAGLNLATRRPAAADIAAAVEAVLADPGYRARAAALQAEFARYHAPTQICALLDSLDAAHEKEFFFEKKNQKTFALR